MLGINKYPRYVLSGQGSIKLFPSTFSSDADAEVSQP